MPESLLRAAVNLGKTSNPAPTYAWRRLATASAFSVVLVVVLVGTWQKTRKPGTKGNPNVDATAMNSVAEVRTTTQALQSSGDKVRGEQESSDSILISPRPDETVDPSDLKFRWKLRDRATFYEIEVVSDAGDSVWKGQSNASSLKLPAHIHLERGKAYYVWIRIHMSRGSIEQSKAVRFTIG